MTTSSIAIIGGGPGGLMLARLLQVRGYAAVVLERDAHRDDRPQGGSLDLHADTGQRALQLAGLEEAFLAEARPEDQGDRLYDSNGRLLFDHDGDGFDRPEIDRSALRRLLLDSLAVGTVRWGSKVEAVTPHEKGGYEVFVGGNSELFDVVVGADGAWSRVRRLLSDAEPIYEGVTFVELGFDASRHPDIDALVGKGKMFAVGDNQLLVGQRNGNGHIRGYVAQRISEVAGRELARAEPQRLRAMLMEAFADWAPELKHMIEAGELLGARPLQALPIGHSWASREGLTLLGDAAHLMSPFAGEGVNLALADAADLAAALTSGESWSAVTHYEVAITARAAAAATEAAEGLQVAVSENGVAGVLEHYRQRIAA
jgi:2-polyprenyl-6-methoxyphenol hydroxylase-like FAD-dependent oxidoreductase